MRSARLLWKPVSGLLVAAFLCTGSVAGASEGQLLTAAGKPAEGPLDVFLGVPRFDVQVVFDEGAPVREPYLAIALDGTLLALRNNKGQLRRSEDGAKTWPVKRLVYAPHAAYSSMFAGRPDTPSEGLIYLLFEDGPDGRYSAMRVARFNLSWILEGQRTGNGQVPPWLRP